MVAKKNPSPKQQIKFAHCFPSVYFQVGGLANMVLANPLENTANQFLQKGYHSFFIDLKECRGMDSTFMGVLIGIATIEDQKEKPTVHIIHANTHNQKLLQSLGVNQVVNCVKEEIPVPENFELLEILPQQPQQKIALIQKAHEKLVEIDPKNEEKFGNFLKLLKQEMIEKQ